MKFNNSNFNLLPFYLILCYHLILRSYSDPLYFLSIDILQYSKSYLYAIYYDLSLDETTIALLALRLLSDLQMLLIKKACHINQL